MLDIVFWKNWRGTTRSEKQEVFYHYWVNRILFNNVLIAALSITIYEIETQKICGGSEIVSHCNHLSMALQFIPT